MGLKHVFMLLHLTATSSKKCPRNCVQSLEHLYSARGARSRELPYRAVEVCDDPAPSIQKLHANLLASVQRSLVNTCGLLNGA